MKKHLEQLKKEKIFSDYAFADLKICDFSKGQRILRQGQQLEDLYILMSGRIKTCHTTSNGNTVLNAVSKALTLIGEVELLTNQELINDVFALEDCICLKIDLAKNKDKLLNDLTFMQYLAKTIAKKLYNTNQNSAISINFPVENRLASYLIACHNDLLVQENFVQVAEMIGCSYRQLQRALNAFCKKGYLLKIARSKFMIVNLEMLERLGEDLYYI